MNILISGGASGLGADITKVLAQDKSNTVYFTYNSAQAKAQQIENEFSNTSAIACNFSDEAAVNELTKKMAELNLDVLIHNAYSGEYLKSHFHKIDTNDFLVDFKNNILPVIELTKAAILSFRKKKSGKIISILTSALIGAPPIGSAVYAANKAYLEKLTKVWANENAKFNITSNSVSPSFMETTLTKNTDERILEQIRESHPLKKILTTQEVAETVLFLVNASNQINGIDIAINAASSIK